MSYYHACVQVSTFAIYGSMACGCTVYTICAASQQTQESMYSLLCTPHLVTIIHKTLAKPRRSKLFNPLVTRSPSCRNALLCRSVFVENRHHNDTGHLTRAPPRKSRRPTSCPSCPRSVTVWKSQSCKRLPLSAPSCTMRLCSRPGSLKTTSRLTGSWLSPTSCLRRVGSTRRAESTR